MLDIFVLLMDSDPMIKQQDERPQIMSRPARPPVPSSRPRILIVEDDANTRWVLCTLMRRFGYDCEVASNGLEALDLVPSFEPQVILMDLMMPILDGLETTRRLKADSKTRAIPVLALTGNVTLHGMSSAQLAGCNDCFPKPIVLENLLSFLRRHLEA